MTADDVNFISDWEPRAGRAIGSRERGGGKLIILAGGGGQGVVAVSVCVGGYFCLGRGYCCCVRTEESSGVE